MGIVKSDQTIAVLGVQGQAVTQPMRTLGTWLNTLHHELDEMPAIRVGEEDFPVEQQQSIEGRIACFAHVRMNVII